MVAVLVAGCSAAGGEASPPDQARSGIPPRPHEVRIDGVDPCSLLTAEQRAELGLDGRPVFDAAPVALYGGADVPLCAIRGFQPRAVAVGISVVTSAGMELYTSGDLAAEVRPVQVRGFPAVVALPTRFTGYCSVIVDVAPGQLLDVQFRDGGRNPPISRDQLCRDAEQVAEIAMGTLIASR
ncbi:hypothetical protein GCM10009610_08710 [Pseudonocardia xinjiangensis]